MLQQRMPTVRRADLAYVEKRLRELAPLLQNHSNGADGSLAAALQ